ncbi:Valine--tRNA ligase [bioreactor metagenome]|uniref:valine--tRNA ligase n=1 Tax=bioreactor metagenome TaxID=1076179 RepID=A0A645EQD6_9ZZZZ
MFVKGDLDHSLYGVIQKMANIVAIDDIANKINAINGITFISYTTEFFVPLEGLTNAADEIKKAEAELAHLQGFLKSVNTKLSNTRFVESAPPQVVEMEKKKRSDAESKMAKLQQLISDLTK